MRIAVLCVQGAFAEHEKALADIGSEHTELRDRRDLDKSFDGLILPGGESTVQGKLLRELDMLEPMRALISDGLPVFGTCAGLILLAKRIENDERRHFSAMDITAVRNAYGRQLGSFFISSDFAGKGKIPMTFIRAPYISSCGSGVDVLSAVDGHAVAAREKNMLVTAFHPELNGDMTVYEYFLGMIEKKL